jgi:archaetidylinositol phosphate synthase
MNGSASRVMESKQDAIQFPEANQKPASFRDAFRLQRSLTAAAERRCLAWLAARVPSWINSDHLTLFGLLSMILAGASYALARWNRAGLICATVCLACNWLGDSLDGTLARFRKCQRPRYGFYVDHVIDMIGGFFLMSGLAISGLIDWRIALAMLISYLMLSIEVYLATYALAVFRLSFVGLGPTEIRILLAVENLVLWFNRGIGVFGSSYRLFDVGGGIATVGMSVMLLVSTLQHTKQLYRQETLR